MFLKRWVIIQYQNEKNLMIGPYKTLPEAKKQAQEWNDKHEGVFSVVPMIEPKEFVKMMKNTSLLHIPIGL
jgi:hypothetical protein